MKHLLLTTIAAVVLVGCGRPSIHKAARDGNIEAVKHHLDTGTDVNSKDRREETPMHHAAWKGHIDIVELLIANGAIVNPRGDNYGRTPLHYAKNIKIVELLINKGADVNVTRKGGWTPLHGAAMRQGELIKLLINKGADVNAKLTCCGDTRGKTALDLAFEHGRTENANLLRSHGGYSGSIHSAAKGGNIEAIKQYLAEGGDVDVKNGDGRTLLHYAAETGQIEIIKLLINIGADMNVKDTDWGHTPLHYAVLKAHKNTAELLIEEGADVNAKSRFGRTPLDKAKRHPETADLLRKHGAKTGEELL